MHHSLRAWGCLEEKHIFGPFKTENHHHQIIGSKLSETSPALKLYSFGTLAQFRHFHTLWMIFCIFFVLKVSLFQTWRSVLHLLVALLCTDMQKQVPSTEGEKKNPFNWVICFLLLWLLSVLVQKQRGLFLWDIHLNKMPNAPNLHLVENYTEQMGTQTGLQSVRWKKTESDINHWCVFPSVASCLLHKNRDYTSVLQLLRKHR